MKEKIMSITIIVLSILAPVLIIPNSIGDYNILKVIVLLISGAVLLITVLSNYKNLYLDKKDILLLIFGGLIFISTMLSSNVKKSIIGQESRYEGLLMFYTYFLIYFCGKKFFKKEYIKTFCKIMYIVVLLICILSIAQYYVTNINFEPIFKVNKSSGSSGTFGNSNFLGSFVSIFLPISIMLYIIKGTRKNLILACIVFMAMLVSLARSSYVAFAIFAILLIAFLVYKRDKKYFFRFLIIVLTFSFAFIILSYTGKETIIKKNEKMVNEFKQVTTTGVTDKMGSSRIEIWKMVLKLLGRHPVFGVGTDNLLEGLYNEEDIRFNELFNYVYRTHNSIDKAHNEYLQIAVTIGIPAIIVYLIFLSMIILGNIKVCRKDDAKLILLLSIISYLVQAFFNISTIGIAPLFWLILGLIDNNAVIEELNK